LISEKERCPKALTAERSSGNMPGKPAFFRYQLCCIAIRTARGHRQV